jgi:hypothetical protein
MAPAVDDVVAFHKEHSPKLLLLSNFFRILRTPVGKGNYLIQIQVMTKSSYNSSKNHLNF